MRVFSAIPIASREPPYIVARLSTDNASAYLLCLNPGTGTYDKVAFFEEGTEAVIAAHALNERLHIPIGDADSADETDDSMEAET